MSADFLRARERFHAKQCLHPRDSVVIRTARRGKSGCRSGGGVGPRVGRRVVSGARKGQPRTAAPGPFRLRGATKRRVGSQSRGAISLPAIVAENLRPGTAGPLGRFSGRSGREKAARSSRASAIQEDARSGRRRTRVVCRHDSSGCTPDGRGRKSAGPVWRGEAADARCATATAVFLAWGSAIERGQAN